VGNSNALRSRTLEDILAKASPRHEPEVEEAVGQQRTEARLSIPTPMLDVIFRNGKIRSFSYAYLAEVEFEPGDTMTLRFTNGTEIVAEGRGIAYHRQQIRLHRAAEIRECSESELALDVEGISQVENITITEGDNL
jgi:hypothetical protein